MKTLLAPLRKFYVGYQKEGCENDEKQIRDDGNPGTDTKWYVRIPIEQEQVGHRHLKTTSTCLLRSTERIAKSYMSESTEIFSKTQDVKAQIIVIASTYSPSILAIKRRFIAIVFNVRGAEEICTS